MTTPTATTTDALMINRLARVALDALRETGTSPHEQIAALKTAAMALESAEIAQNTATMLANVKKQMGG